VSSADPVPGEGAPGTPTKDEKFTAQLAWVLNVFVPVLAPILLWRLQAKTSRFVEHHAKTSSNHALTVMVYILVVLAVFGGGLWAVMEALGPLESEGALWTFIVAVSLVSGLGGLLILALIVFTLVLHVVALVKIGAGEWYKPPMCWRFMK
jgi:uncharacterized Tic20 family protein